MNTILVDIKEQDLPNFILLSSYNLASLNEQGHEKLFKELPFTLYRKRMMGDYMVTIQISIINYCLFLGHGLIK